MFKLILLLMLGMSKNALAATHCQTAPDSEFKMTISINSEQVKYVIGGRPYLSPRIENHNGSFNLFDTLQGTTIIVRNILVNGTEGILNMIAINMTNSDIIFKEKVPLTCVTVQ
ncbi:hypothetical protein [Photobacterium angustum]|uniref:DP-EP family protein n=1 Tax=Photobacterium angustum TaxID=661 RepID=A0A855SIR9_PHOAN|nr:hypothetical protein [Photobacterium angustum]KJF83573.1 hypothetical protein UB36_03305 [Photobacterium damselae subsp. damselae]KJG42562.1 hypothetical protein UA35_00755 [Photobacterium angustum]KJG47881.1 hypothetical protein UA31_03305 [Photobacterium angustum]KJG49861.1 hypothetical protein UA30_04885 [Photobacterium angustum]KJG54046.1 hypothetical protein UA34_07265 [Photobacterium angustum]